MEGGHERSRDGVADTDTHTHTVTYVDADGQGATALMEKCDT